MQRQCLAAAQPGGQHQPEHLLEPVAAHLFEQALGVLKGEVGGIPTVDGRPLGRRGGVAAQQPVADGHVQGAPEDGVDRPHGGRRETGLPLGHDERLDVGGPDPVERLVAQDGHEVLARDGGVEVDSRLLAVAGWQRLRRPIVQSGGKRHRGILDRRAGFEPFTDLVELGMSPEHRQLRAPR